MSAQSKRHAANTAAAMFGGATFVALIEGVVPGGPELSLLPGLIALCFVALLLALGPRLPVAVLGALGPIGVVLIGVSIASTPIGQGDGVMLYIWPVLWVAVFFGHRVSVLIVACVGIVQGAVLIHSGGVLDRWIDLMVSVGIVAAVVNTLAGRNQRLLERLAAEARIDTLTGVLNRRGFEDQAAHEIERARREGRPVAAAAFDIDHFKRVNDEWGHEVGDRVLEHLGAVLLTATRSSDVVARVGGEEFVTLLPGANGAAAERYAERVRGEFGQPVDGLPRVTLSAGVTSVLMPSSAEELLAVADSALYEAKRSGRDRTVVHGPAALPVG